MGSMDSVDPEAVQCMHLLTNLHAFNNSPVLRHRRHHLGSKREMLAFSDVLHRTPAETLLLHQHSHMLTSLQLATGYLAPMLEIKNKHSMPAHRPTIVLAESTSHGRHRAV